jgi:penicillin V acylase-like amidase (Ntn superfamily)
MRRIALLTLLLALGFASRHLYACTIFVSAQGDSVMVGNNLDAADCYPKVWFVPPANCQYGRLCFGFDDSFRIAEGGMNDQGLYISVNALSEETGWVADSTLQDWEEWEGWFESGVPDGILAMCATVDEAVDVFRRYNLFTLQRVKFLLADKTGNSVVIEWSKGALQFLRRGDKDYQVSTNFVTSSYKPEDVPCYRYRAAASMFEASKNARSVDVLRGVLSVTHNGFMTPTVYSNICNLNTGDIYIYYFHNYEEVLKINLREKLKGGRSEYLVGDLFKVKPYVATVYEQYRVKK